jgi:hypothetical protein
MARVIHMSDTDAVLVNTRYPTRSITISDGIIAHAMPVPMRLALLSSPVPAGEVSVSDMMVGVCQESGKTALAEMVVNDCSTPNQNMCLRRWGAKDSGRGCRYVFCTCSGESVRRSRPPAKPSCCLRSSPFIEMRFRIVNHRYSGI